MSIKFAPLFLKKKTSAKGRVICYRLMLVYERVERTRSNNSREGQYYPNAHRQNKTKTAHTNHQ